MSYVDRSATVARGWIDIHCHYAPPDFPSLAAARLGSEFAIEASSNGSPDCLVRYGRRIEFLPGELSRMVGLDERIVHMDAVGTAVQVISPPTFFAFYEQPPEVAAYLVSALNDAILDAVARFPDRLLALVTVPLQDPELAIRELERVASPAVRGIIMGSSIGGRQLDDAVLLPFYEAADEMGLAIFIHPTSSDLAGADRMQEYFLHNLIGNPTNTTLAAARLIFSGVMTRHPKLRICLAHAGGYLAWALGRLTRGHSKHIECRAHTDESPRDQARRFYVDTIAHDSRSLEYLLATFGDERLVCGSDYPFEIGYADAGRLVDELQLEPSVHAAVLRGNAERFLGLAGTQSDPALAQRERAVG